MTGEQANQCNNLIEAIKKEIAKQVDKEYTEYKLKCLKDLDIELECKRNECVKSILNGIDVLISNDNPMTLEPDIHIRIEKKVYIKGD